MFERFTDQSRRAVVLAQEEARRAIERHLGMDPGAPVNVVPPS